MTAYEKIIAIIAVANKCGKEHDEIVAHARHLIHLHGYTAERAAEQAMYCRKYGVGLDDFSKIYV